MQFFYSLSPPVQALLASLFLYAMTALGASFVFFSGKGNERVLTALTGFAAGVMIAASFFSLLLPSLSYGEGFSACLCTTGGFLLGGAFIILSDLALSRAQFRFQGLGGRQNTLMYCAVTLHNIPEGMAVGVAFAQGLGSVGAIYSALLLALGIGIQNFPEGMCIAFPLRKKGMSPLKSFLFAQGSGAVEIPACVLGALTATLIVGFMPWALAFSAGAMIAVVCSELIPECFSGNKTVASVGVVLGFCAMMLLDVALG